MQALLKIKEKYEDKLTEVAVSQILYELNTIWRTIMRKEVDAVRSKLTDQIQDLKRQLVTKDAYDKSELMQECTRQKRMLSRERAKK